MQPSFEPSINSPSILYQKKGKILGLVDKEWTEKSHLERLAEDLEKRKKNLDEKIEKQQIKEEASKGKKFSANWKSENYLYF